MKLRQVLMALMLSVLAATAFGGYDFMRGHGGGGHGGGGHGGHGGGGGGGHGGYHPPHPNPPYPHPAPNPVYTCVARDAAGGQYTGNGYNRNAAANNAINFCYQRSYQSNTCQVTYCN